MIQKCGSIHITPLANHIGARVSGVNLSGNLDAGAVATIRHAFLEHLVLVFPAQDLEPAQQVAFTEQFGVVEPHPMSVRASADPEGKCMVFENKPGRPGARNDFWHSDISYSVVPPSASVLHGVIVPDGRGDTMFCNMYRAWEQMSLGMQRLLAPLSAEHSGEILVRRSEQSKSDANKNAKRLPPVTHPVLRRHSESVRTALYTNTAYATNFSDMSREESQLLLDYIETVATVDDNIYRHQWRTGDVVMWDNRCTMHYAVYDYLSEEARRMHRTTAAGDHPVAP